MFSKITWGLTGLLAGLAALDLSACTASDSKTYTLRIGAGHPSGPAVYTTQLQKFFVPEVERRVAEETAYKVQFIEGYGCLLYTSPSPRDRTRSRMPSSA